MSGSTPHSSRAFEHKELTQLLDCLGEAVTVHALADGTVLYANREAGKLLGIEGGDDFPAWRENLALNETWNRAKAGAVAVSEWRIPSGTGERWVETRVRRHEFGHGPVIVATWLDVTRRHQAVEALQKASQTLSQANDERAGCVEPLTTHEAHPANKQVRMCAWTGRVTLEEYLARHFKVQLTHGVSDVAVERLRREAQALQALKDQKLPPPDK
jgi:hypothetical protein